LSVRKTQPMARRLVAIFILCLFTAAVTGVNFAMEVEKESISSHHDDGAPCHDGHDTEPCDDGCTCVCCPGHFVAMGTLLGGTLLAHTDPKNCEFHLPVSNHPAGILSGVFRPPRA
jgi:hypothetical protein